MSKIRVYEIAKELNTTSKRLIEKLEEINVVVKNHMSLLTDDELNALYNHIGVIKHNDSQNEENVSKSNSRSSQKEFDKNKVNKPRIIRKTEIIIDTQKPEDTKNNNKDYKNNNFRNNTRNNKNQFVKVADKNAGLMSGFTRENNDYKKDIIERRNSTTEHKDKFHKRSNEMKNEQKVSNETTNIDKESKSKIEKPTGIEKNMDIKSVDKRKNEDTKKVNSQANTEYNVNDLNSNIYEEKNNFNKNIRVNDDKADIKPGNKEKHNFSSQQFKNYKKNLNDKKDSEGQQRNYQGRQQGGQQRNYQDRQQGGQQRNYQDRQQGGQQRNYQDRQQGGQQRNYQDRQQGGQQRSYQGGQNNRQFNGNKKDDTRSYTDRKNNQRQNESFRSKSRPLEIPTPDISAAKIEEKSAQRGERRSFQGKEIDKGAKKEFKKDAIKSNSFIDKSSKLKNQKLVLGEKKGVSEILSEDFILNEFYNDDGAKKRKRGARNRKNEVTEQSNKHIPQKAVLTSITIGDSITVKELAESLKKTSSEVIKKLMNLGIMATLNQELDFDTASIVSDEFGIKTEKAVVVNEEDILFDDTEDKEEALKPRAPVVVVMGHVDHGKTSLLDAMREANVTESEAGGITQHIGAYTVNLHGRNITFLDTPGHEAFTAMRARGAQVTDIAILVVAADDGVMPQTVEAINHAKAANVSIIVAVNKIDKPGANPERVKQELTEHGLVVEEWGGDIISVPVSAKEKTNIDQLLEMVLLTADVLELKSNPNRQAKGTVIEAKLDKGRGAVATMLVQRGTLNVGDSIVTGTTVGRVRAMTDDKGHSIKSAGPSTPVEILGLPEVPEAGEIFYAITDEKVAKQLAEKRKIKQREEQLNTTSKVTLDDLFNQIKEGKVKDLNIIVKADVQGSVEAVKQSLEKLTNDEVRVKTIHGGVGAITESDVKLAEVSNAIIIGFNVRPAVNVAETAQAAGVDLRLYRVIYNAIEDIEAAMNGMLEPTFKEVILGHAEVRQTFKASGIGTIGGSYVTDGKIVRNSEIRIIRDGIIVHEGKLASLKRFKDDIKEAAQGYECGVLIERFNDIKEGDIIESFAMEEVKK